MCVPLSPLVISTGTHIMNVQCYPLQLNTWDLLHHQYSHAGLDTDVMTIGTYTLCDVLAETCLLGPSCTHIMNVL